MNLGDSYNIAVDCIDKNSLSAINQHKKALFYIGHNSQGSPAGLISYSYFQLKELTSKFANILGDLEIGRGERIILRLPNIPEFPIAFLGSIKAGVIPVPTSYLLAPRELEFIIKDSGSSILVTTPDLFPEEWKKNRPSFLKHLFLVTDYSSLVPEGFDYFNFNSLLKEASRNFEVQPTSPEDPAYWLYTSGTDSLPKGVIHAHRSVPAHDERVDLWMNLRGTDIVFNTSNLNWSYALTSGLLDVWRHGAGALIFSGKPTAENICQIVRENGVTLFLSVPGLYKKITDYLQKSAQVMTTFVNLPQLFGPVRLCLSSGEKLAEPLRIRFKKITGHKIREGLGMTEHSVYIVQQKDKKVLHGSCGQMLPSSRVAILTKNLVELPPGQIGMLASHRSCPGLMLGYHDPYGRLGQGDSSQDGEEGTIEFGFKGEWFLSGDWAYQDVSGNFYYVGREDDLITAGGHRVSPFEVEWVINQLSEVCESAVVSEEGEPGKTLITAYVVKNPEVSSGLGLDEKIIKHCKKNLARYKVPKLIRFIDQIPKTSNGKIKRKALAQFSDEMSGFFNL